ncbi:methyl-accepting chemotaxis protein [Paenibacillus ferrarius]|nr:HAMP domain-containing methyl-accepting chemotaxis protein [Paenibacillus ferrarius]
MTELINTTAIMVQRDIDKNELKALSEGNKKLKQASEQVIALTGTNVTAAVGLANSELIPVGREMEALANKIAEGQKQLVDESSAYNSEMIESTKRDVLLISIIALVSAIVVGVVISRLISKPIILVAAAAKRVASGDLTHNDINVRNRDEVGELADSFNQMVHHLRELILQVKTGADQVTSSSEELTASAQQTNWATEQIALAIQEVAAGTEKQVEIVMESVQAVNEMSTGAEQIAVNAQSVSSSVSVAADKSLEGKHAIQQVVAQMNSIHTIIQDLSVVIQGLRKRSTDIGEITGIITAIASQTNLLALNASIEAARAGEQGRGFAVVASEIRKLAEQSSESSGQIIDLISTIQQETHHAAQCMDLGIKEVNEGIHIVHMAGTSFQHIEQSVLTVVSQIQEVAAAAEQMSASTDQVGSSMTTISNIVEQSASRVQLVSASTEEQLASMEEVSSSASALSKLAEGLQDQMVRFKL